MSLTSQGKSSHSTLRLPNVTSWCRPSEGDWLRLSGLVTDRRKTKTKRQNDNHDYQRTRGVSARRAELRTNLNHYLIKRRNSYQRSRALHVVTPTMAAYLFSICTPIIQRSLRNDEGSGVLVIFLCWPGNTFAHWFCEICEHIILTDNFKLALQNNNFGKLILGACL